MGINWSPFHHPDYDSSSKTSIKAVIDEDFSAIADAGFDLVRTFYARHGSSGVEPAGYAAEYGLQLALGEQEGGRKDLEEGLPPFQIAISFEREALSRWMRQYRAPRLALSVLVPKCQQIDGTY